MRGELDRRSQARIALLRQLLRRAQLRAATSPGVLVDDVVAETFLVAWRRIDDLPDDVRPWLLGVARKTLSTHLRSARRRTSLVEKLSAAELPAAFSQVDGPDSG